MIVRVPRPGVSTPTDRWSLWAPQRRASTGRRSRDLGFEISGSRTLSYAERNEVRPGRMYNFADLADEEGGTPWPEIEELMPMAIAAVKSAFDSYKEELKNLDNTNKKHVILPAVEAIVMATPAEELKKYRDLVLPRRAERIETKKKSK